MQFVMIKNYDQLPALLMKHQAHVDSVLKPLLDEIVDEDPDENNDAAFKILYRKICIYIFLASGLGSPTMSIVSRCYTFYNKYMMPGNTIKTSGNKDTYNFIGSKATVCAVPACEDTTYVPISTAKNSAAVSSGLRVVGAERKSLDT